MTFWSVFVAFNCVLACRFWMWLSSVDFHETHTQVWCADKPRPIIRETCRSYNHQILPEQSNVPESCLPLIVAIGNFKSLVWQYHVKQSAMLYLLFLIYILCYVTIVTAYIMSVNRQFNYLAICLPNCFDFFTTDIVLQTPTKGSCLNCTHSSVNCTDCGKTVGKHGYSVGQYF